MSDAAATGGTTLRSLAQGARHWLVGALALAVLAIAALSVHRYVALERELTEAALARRAALASLAASTLSEKFDRLVDVGVSLATRVRFQQLVADGRWTEAAQILRRIPEDFAYLDRVLLADVRGTLMADMPELPGVRGMNFAQRDWFKGVSREWQPYVSRLYRRTAAPRRNVIAIAVPIGIRDAGVAGILVMQVKLETFFDWARRLDPTKGSRFVFVDRDGRAAFDSAAALADPSDPGADLARRTVPRQPGVEVVRVGDTAEERVVSYASTERHGWGVFAELSAPIAFGARDGLLRQLLIDGGAIVLLAIAAIVLGTMVALQRRQAQADRAQRAELELRVRERTAQLEAANKELEAFSYSVSHDLRAPLRAIDGYALMLEEDHGARLDAEGRRLLGVVRGSAGQMARLIDDLLRFSQVSRKPLAIGPLDMSALVREVVAELAQAYPKARIDLASLPAVAGDRALLKHVWTNLIGNALKYSARREEPRVEIGGSTGSAESLYWVRDNGAGFDMRYREKLFKVFQRLHREEEFEGTGVGLAIVQRVIARHGGRVWGEGAVGGGACFHFSLPGEG